MAMTYWHPFFQEYVRAVAPRVLTRTVASRARRSGSGPCEMLLEQIGKWSVPIVAGVAFGYVIRFVLIAVAQ